jgi:protein TonB
MKEKKIKSGPVFVIGMDEIPLPSDYGAAEMKFYIRRNTYRGAIITLLLLLLFLLFNVIKGQVERSAADIKVAPITKMSLEDLPPADAETSELPPPPDVVINTGPAVRAGNPVPVPDAMIAPDVQDFATIDVQDRSSHKGGTGEDLGGFAGGIDWDGDKKVEVTKLNEDPSPDDFVPVEKDPVFDMVKLQSLVVYPDMARRAGIEGTVIVRALVDKSGKITKVLIESSDNQALNKAAENALKEYGYATPAVMNQQPTSCWISVPIKFRLR